jgi:hypothetical protein
MPSIPPMLTTRMEDPRRLAALLAIDPDYGIRVVDQT